MNESTDDLYEESELTSFLKEVLDNCGFCSDKKSVDFLLKKTLEIYGEDTNVEELSFFHLYYIISILHPTRLLPYEFYLNSKLCPIAVYLIHERLKLKELTVTVMVFRELCFFAKRNEHNPKFKSLTHVCNSAVKTYDIGKWHTPEGFKDVFDQYKDKVDQIN